MEVSQHFTNIIYFIWNICNDCWMLTKWCWLTEWISLIWIPKKYIYTQYIYMVYLLKQNLIYLYINFDVFVLSFFFFSFFQRRILILSFQLTKNTVQLTNSLKQNQSYFVEYNNLLEWKVFPLQCFRSYLYLIWNVYFDNSFCNFKGGKCFID